MQGNDQNQKPNEYFGSISRKHQEIKQTDSYPENYRTDKNVLNLAE
jgi:hypothetical protein